MIKTGVIGNQSFCCNTIEKLLDVNEFKVIGFHNTQLGEDSFSGQDYKLKSYSHTSELINDVDAVIAMPPFSTPNNVSYFVKQSKHVFFELSNEYCKREASRLSAIIDEANVKVQVGFHHRYINTFLAAKKFINKPKFIQSNHYKKYSNQTNNSKMLLDMLIGDVDIVLSVVNSDVKSVVANAASIMPGTPDVINVRIEFFNGCVAQLTVGLIATEDSHSFGFYCAKDFINLDLSKNKAWVIRKKDENSELKLFQQNIGDLNVEQINVKPNNHLYDEFSAFAKSIVYNTSPEVSVESTLETLAVIQQIKEKIKLSVCY